MAKAPIPPAVLDELLKHRSAEELLGADGLMKGLKKALMERMLGAELSSHLGYEAGETPPATRRARRS